MLDLARFSAGLERLWPHGDSKITGLRAAMAAQAPAMFAKYGVATSMAAAVFMGEISEECASGTEVEENLNYRASALHSQWPTHFNMAQALLMQHQPHRIANQAYNGRMGNRVGTDDGWNFRGRGGSQTTGRDAYAELGKLLSLDLLTHPELLNTTEYFLEASLVDFVTICKCLPYADLGQVITTTRRLNGGLIGLSQRETSVRLWKPFFGIEP